MTIIETIQDILDRNFPRPVEVLALSTDLYKELAETTAPQIFKQDPTKDSMCLFRLRVERHPVCRGWVAMDSERRYLASEDRTEGESDDE